MKAPQILTITYGSVYGAMLFGTSIYCAFEIWKQDKAESNDNKSEAIEPTKEETKEEKQEDEKAGRDATYCHMHMQPVHKRANNK